jgi:hypothetical protein
MGLARAIARLFNLGFYDASGGFQEGQVAVFGAQPFQVQLPSGATPHLQPVAGINRTAGFMGGSGTTLGEEISIQKLGYGKFLVSPQASTELGGNVIADSSAGNLGNAIQRVPYSHSAWLLGHFEEARQVGAGPELVEGEVLTTMLEVIRSITAASPAATPIGNNVTRYLGAPGTAVSQTPVPLYRARFSGEVVRNLGVTLAVAPATNETMSVNVVHSSDGGKTWQDLPLACPLTPQQATDANLTDSAVLAAGDVVGVKVVSYSAAAAGLVVSLDIT